MGWPSNLLNYKVREHVGCAGSWSSGCVQAEVAYSGVIEVFKVGGCGVGCGQDDFWRLAVGFVKDNFS